MLSGSQKVGPAGPPHASLLLPPCSRWPQAAVRAYLARPGRLAGAAAAVGQGRPVSGRRRLWPRELLLLKGLEVGVLLLQLPLEPLRLPLLLQLLPLVLLGPRQGALSARP